MRKNEKLILNEKFFPSMKMRKEIKPTDPRILTAEELDEALDYMEDFSMHLDLELEMLENKNQREYLTKMDKFIRRMRERLLGKEICDAFERDVKMLDFDKLLDETFFEKPRNKVK